MQRAKLVTPSLLRKGGPKGKQKEVVKKKKKKLPRKRPSAGRNFNAKWVEDDDEVSEGVRMSRNWTRAASFKSN